MTEISRRYARLAAAFADKVAAVPDFRWSKESPCEGWSARQVVAHVVDSQGMFLGLVGQDMGELPSVDEYPLSAVEAATARIRRELADPERAQVTFEGHFGTTTFEAAVDRFLCFDLVVHGWDLARATGQDETIAPEDVARVREQAEAFGDAMRGPGAFGPEVAVPDDAGEQDKLLAFLGRRP